MKPESILDKPEEKRLNGLDLIINHYHIINPDQGELLIREIKKFNLGFLTAAILFGAMAALFVYICADSYEQSGTSTSFLLAAAFATFMLLLASLAVYLLLANNVQCYFTAHEVIATNAFGRKRILPRSAIRSVFITKEIRLVNNRQEGFNYFVSLRISSQGSSQKDFRLLQIQEKNSPASILGGLNSAAMRIAEEEALQIATCISEHWRIPFKI